MRLSVFVNGGLREALWPMHASEALGPCGAKIACPHAVVCLTVGEGEGVLVSIENKEESQSIYTGVRGILAGMIAEDETRL